MAVRIRSNQINKCFGFPTSSDLKKKKKKKEVITLI